MEIIEEGRKTYECGICGCKFKITSNSEINRTDRVLVDTGVFLSHLKHRYCDSVKCPQCGEKIIIKWR